MVERLGLQLCDNVPLNEVRELVGVGRSDVRFDPSPTDHLTYREYPVYRVWYQNRWIENVPVEEALVSKEEGHIVQRMDLPFSTPPNPN